MRTKPSQAKGASPQTTSSAVGSVLLPTKFLPGDNGTIPEDIRGSGVTYLTGAFIGAAHETHLLTLHTRPNGKGFLWNVEALEECLSGRSSTRQNAERAAGRAARRLITQIIEQQRQSDEVEALRARLEELERRVADGSTGEPSGEHIPLRYRIKAERQRRGLSQAQLAELLGCAGQTISSWEKGHASPTGDRSKRLDAFLRQEVGAQPIGVRLTAKREGLGWSRHDLGEYLDCTARSVSNWERGRCRPQGRFHDAVQAFLRDE